MEGEQFVLLKFDDPSHGDLMNGNRIKVVQFLPAVPDADDEVCPLEYAEVLGHSLAGHVEVRAKLNQRLAVADMQLVEQLAPTLVSQGFEYRVHQESQ